jgi:hypothetical protein
MHAAYVVVNVGKKYDLPLVYVIYDVYDKGVEGTGQEKEKRR